MKKIDASSYYGDISGVSPKEAFKIIADWAASETHKRKYPHDELKKISENLIILDRFFEQYEEVFK